MTATNTTVDFDEENKGGDSDRSGDGGLLEKGELEAKSYGIDSRKYDIDYLLRNAPFKAFSTKEVHDWSRYRIYSILQMPEHPGYGK